MRVPLTLLVLAAGLAAGAPAAAQAPRAFEPTMERYTDLPEGAGRQETFYACAACHGLAIIRRQSLSRDGWDDMLKLMVTRHGMNEIEAAERGVILDYLARTFPVRTAPGGGWRNPFAGN